MTDDDVKLRECPFCGEAPRWVDDDSYGDCQVFCANEYNGCPAPMSFGRKAEKDRVVAEWNRRPNSSSPDGRTIEECAKVALRFHKECLAAAKHYASAADGSDSQCMAEALLAKEIEIAIRSLSPTSEPVHNPDSPKPLSDEVPE